MIDGILKDWECRRAFLANRVRVREIEASLREALGVPLHLTSRNLRGRDDILEARHARRTLALVRVYNPHKRESWRGAPIPGAPVLCIEGPGRVAREWAAYERLAPAGLAPRPLWRDTDAMACEPLDLPRASDALKRHPERIWDRLDALFGAVASMHALGVVHLDLGVSNALLAPDGSRVSFIDFEYAPTGAVDDAAQRMYDFLRLINNCLKRRRGGHALARDYPRLAQMLLVHADRDARAVDVAPLLCVIPKIARNIPLRAALAVAVPSLAP